MKMHGLFQNRMYETMVNTPAPEVGMGATEMCYSDRHAYTVIAISPTGKTITLQADEAKVVKGSTYDGSAEYEYSPNPQGITRQARRNRAGQWKILHGNIVVLGMRNEYYDPSF